MAHNPKIEFRDLRQEILENAKGDLIGDFYRGECSPPTPPAFILGFVTQDILRFYFNERYVWPISCYRVGQAGVGGEGVITKEDFIYVCPQLNFHKEYLEIYGSGVKRFVEQRKTAFCGEAALLTGPGYKLYGHWLVDFLPKLFILHAAGFDIYKISYVLPHDIPDFALGWLHLAGIQDRQLVYYSSIDETLVVESLIIPTVLRTNARAALLFKDSVRFLLDLVRGSAPLSEHPASGAKLYITRRLLPPPGAGTAGQRTLVNRQNIEEIAIKYGFQIMAPETLSIEQQITAFAGAKQIVGEYGSNLHSSIFSKPGTAVCALRTNENASWLGFLQSGLGEAMGHRTGYVFGEPRPTDDVGFTIDEKDFDEAMKLLSLYKYPL